MKILILGGTSFAGPTLMYAPNDFLEMWQTLDMDKDPETNRGVRPGVKLP
jgi:hypothetical protein